MKKLFTLLILSVKLVAVAQNNGPTIDLKYLPVAGTGSTEVWNTHVTKIPSAGANQVWNYYQAFSSVKQHNEIHIVNTYYYNQIPNNTNRIDTTITNNAALYATQANNKARSLSPTHALFLTLPAGGSGIFNDIVDSSYEFLRIDTNGLFIVGVYNIKDKYDTCVRYQVPELVFPPNASMNSATIYDSAHYTIDKVNANSGNVHVDAYVKKTFVPHGFGTLILPNTLGTDSIVYKDVLVTKVISHRVHYLTIAGTTVVDDIDKEEYFFLRNNPFGTAYLMWVSAAASNPSLAVNTYYINPYKTGYISGKVFTDSTETTKVTVGKAYLYRDSSNFKKNDILAVASLDSIGQYKFDSIPFGNYRIAIRPDTSIYHNAFITYYGDKTEWTSANRINTVAIGGDSDGNNIHLLYENQTLGNNQISGNVTSGYYSHARINGANAVLQQAKPIAGIGIRACKRPGGSSARQMQTDANGNFKLTNLSTGDYFLIVDIPGLPSDTCSFTVTNNSKLGFSYSSDSSKINVASCAYLVASQSAFQATNLHLQAMPNPITETSLLQYNLDVATPVYISIINLLGKEVAVLQNTTQQQGNYSLTINTQAYNLTSGAYIVKLSTNQGTMQLKLLYQ